MYGSTPTTKKFAKRVALINQGQEGNGAVVFVGSASARGANDLTEYSNIAGIVAANTVVVPTSGLAARVAESSTTKIKSGTFRRIVGTSVAAPTVSGALALMVQALRVAAKENKLPEPTGQQLAVLLLDTAKPIKTISVAMVEKLRRSTNLSKASIKRLPPEAIYGRGMVDIYAAIKKGKEILSKGQQLPNTIRPVKFSNEIKGILTNARYDVFAEEMYVYLKQSDATALQINILLEELPIDQLIDYPLYEDDGKTIRAYPKVAFKRIYEAHQELKKVNPEGIAQHRRLIPKASSYFSAIALYYALTLPEGQRNQVLKQEWENYSSFMLPKLKDKFLENMPESLKMELGAVPGAATKSERPFPATPAGIEKKVEKITVQAASVRNKIAQLKEKGLIYVQDVHPSLSEQYLDGLTLYLLGKVNDMQRKAIEKKSFQEFPLLPSGGIKVDVEIGTVSQSLLAADKLGLLTFKNKTPEHVENLAKFLLGKMRFNELPKGP
ncbi:MAG: S8 family serine peptidase [Pseudomonadota bacterium]